MYMVLDRENQPVISNSANICTHLITSNVGSLANSTDLPPEASGIAMGDS